MSDRLLSTAEAARAIGVSPRSLSRWVSEGKVKPNIRTPGGQARFDLDDLKGQLHAWRLEDDQQE